MRPASIIKITGYHGRQGLAGNQTTRFQQSPFLTADIRGYWLGAGATVQGTELKPTAIRQGDVHGKRRNLIVIEKPDVRILQRQF
ncbi:hypothetical protein [Spirosoma fluminis]